VCCTCVIVRACVCVQDMCIHEGGVSGYYSDPWNVLGSIQMILFLIDTIAWLVRCCAGSTCVRLTVQPGWGRDL
jgi:hypothetical protein